MVGEVKMGGEGRGGGEGRWSNIFPSGMVLDCYTRPRTVAP